VFVYSLLVKRNVLEDDPTLEHFKPPTPHVEATLCLGHGTPLWHFVARWERLLLGLRWFRLGWCLGGFFERRNLLLD